ncbi:MAG: peptidyl-prolyl cis-trans isomerase [Deltaproteobacteria bacterium]|nr:peptidyl-prolyl cis-trans isomerase [Deltaproteobacteria bacterium]MBN2673348.1 peptidyl-prolyl cis-trans isomerase [Deltaproteobacteria bacterium]
MKKHFKKHFHTEFSVIILGVVCCASSIGCSSEDSAPNVSTNIEAWDSHIKAKKLNDSMVLAQVNGIPIYPETVEFQAKQLQQKLSKEEALAEAIDFYLLEEEARRRGYARDKTVISEFKKALALAYLKKEGEAFTEKSIPLETLKKRYESQKFRFVHGAQRDVVHALAMTGDGLYSDNDAKRIAREMSIAAANADSEKAFRQAVATVGADGTKIRVEDLPPFDQRNTGFVKPFVEGTFAIDYPGQKVSKPIKTKFGYHVIFVKNEEPAVDISFTDARKTLENEIFSFERQKYISELIDDVYNRGNVFIYDIEINNSNFAESAH